MKLHLLARGVVFGALLAHFAHAEAPGPAADSAQSKGVLHPLRDAAFEGNLRTFYMATQNQGELFDWHSLAVGGNVGLRTARISGFGFGTTLYASAAAFGNTGTLDPDTGRASRYELGLYDVNDPERREVALLGEAYLDFSHEGHHVWAGRHLVKTPLFNPQDGRMIPTLGQGLWYKYSSPHHLTLQAGLLTHVAPRSTDRFVSIADSIGLYPAGRSSAGPPSSYLGNVDSAGLGVASLAYSGERFEAQVWDFWVENVFNAVYSDAFIKWKAGPIKFRMGGQAILEHKLQNGGSDDPNSAYFDQQKSQTFGAKLEMSTHSGWSLSNAYNRITADGRFLFPREWGREPLFVFQKRERTEGFGDVHAFLVELGKVWKSERAGSFMTKLGYGNYYRTAPTEPELNKYGFPSLLQANFDAFYYFPEPFRGLSAEVLTVYKRSLGGAPENPAFIQDKVNMVNFNVVLNYQF